MTSSARGQTGFTLVETLIALSVFALIALGGVALLNITLTSQERLDKVSDQTRALQRMQAIMRADFGQMVERQSRGEAGALAPVIAPNRSGALLQFARLGKVVDPDAPRPQLEKIRYRVASGTLYRTAYSHADGASEGPEVALLDHVEDARIRVFVDGRWVDASGSTFAGALPQAIQLQLTHRIYGQLALRYLTPSNTAAAPRQQTAVS